jgi:hypothetical protein
MTKMEKYALEEFEKRFSKSTNSLEEEDIFDGDDTDNEVDLSGPVDYSDTAKVLERIFAVVEKYPHGGETAWYYFLNDWDRRFVLNIYDMWVTTGKAPLSLKQQSKAKVILRKMMTPSMG